MPTHLREFRRRRGLTQAQLAQQTGLDQSYLSKVERGSVASPSWETVAVVSRALGADPRDVFPVQAWEQAS